MTKKVEKKKKTGTDTLRLPVWKTVYEVTVYSNKQISLRTGLEDVLAVCDSGIYVGNIGVGRAEAC